ncbi:hypothetical protein ABT160_32960 [Streptomyces sp. NPDC001941]|uniref:hypothetical protein n=1 Tax=Streptomyces sp. NPDC001941 TaxID=3154659 RepID=UPI00332BB66E
MGIITIENRMSTNGDPRGSRPQSSSIGESVRYGSFALQPPQIRAAVVSLIAGYRRLEAAGARGRQRCEGPLFVHQDGTFECHGGCPNPTGTWHTPAALQYCTHARTPHRRSPLRKHCPACTPATLRRRRR